MEYENFAIEIGDPVDGRFPLKVHSETMGEAEGVLALSLDSPDLVAAQQRLGPGTLPSDFLAGFGEQLWNALFAGEIRDIYRECFGRVRRDDDRGLRIRLCIEPPPLSALPWELAYDRNRDAFLATSSKTPLTRYISLHEPIEELTTRPPVKVLVAIPGGSGLDVAQERALIEDALLELGESVKVTVLEGDVSRAAISRALLEGRHQVLHFIGHGKFQQDDGFLVLNRDEGTGGEDLIPARSFAGFFRDYPSMKLVVLNACQGATVAAARPLAGVAPQLVRAGVPAVVAMQYPVADAAAVLFAREFYLCLCVGANRGRVDAAISHARNRMQMDFANTVAFATPVLYMRSPSGVIFDLEPAGRKADLRMGRAEVDRLKAVKQARKNNIAALQESTGADAAKTAALEHESRQIGRIDRRIQQYYATITAVVAASLVLLFASWVGLFNAFKLDDWLERRFVAYMDGFVEAPLDPRIALVLASADATQNGALGAPSPDWRCHHAKLVSGLAAARASVVAFDLHFADPSGCDREFAEAIRKAAGAGTAVVLGTEAFELDDGMPRPLMSPVLAEAIEDRWGLVKGRPDTRRVQVAAPFTQEVPATIEQREAAVVPSLSLQTVMQHMRRERSGARLAAAVDRRAGVVRVRDASRNELRAIPIVDADLDMIVAVAHSHEVQPTRFHEILGNAHDPVGLKRFKDKIVVIGYGTPDDRWAVSSGDQHYGVELQASAISNILRKVYTQPARPLVQFFVILVMGATGALLRTRAVRRRARLAIPFRGTARARGHMEIPWAMLAVVLAYGLVVFFVYKQQRQILDISYHVAALFLVYLMVGWAQTGTFVTRTPKEA